MEQGVPGYFTKEESLPFFQENRPPPPHPPAPHSSSLARPFSPNEQANLTCVASERVLWKEEDLSVFHYGLQAVGQYKVSRSLKQYVLARQSCSTYHCWLSETFLPALLPIYILKVNFLFINTLLPQEIYIFCH